MEKIYKARNMVYNGRYAVLFEKLPDEQKQDVISRMDQLIEEEKEYEDKGNYGHLCNIFPTIAIDEVLQANDKTPEHAYDIISKHMWAALSPEKYQKMSKWPFFLPLMKKIVPIGFRKMSGKGWKYTWFKKEPRDIFHFECNQCLYQYEFAKRDLLERFGPMFCYSDEINYGHLHNIDFIRHNTLCKGGDKCDFCFVRHSRDKK